jgi:hypothetical protein
LYGWEARRPLVNPLLVTHDKGLRGHGCAPARSAVREW